MACYIYYEIIGRRHYCTTFDALAYIILRYFGCLIAMSLTISEILCHVVRYKGMMQKEETNLVLGRLKSRLAPGN